MQLGHKGQGTAALTDLHDGWVPNALTGCKVGSVVKALILGMQERKKQTPPTSELFCDANPMLAKLSLSCRLKAVKRCMCVCRASFAGVCLRPASAHFQGFFRSCRKIAACLQLLFPHMPSQFARQHLLSLPLYFLHLCRKEKPISMCKLCAFLPQLLKDCYR